MRTALYTVCLLIVFATIQKALAIEIPTDQFEKIQNFKKPDNTILSVGWLYIDAPKQDRAVLVTLDNPQATMSKKKVPVIQTEQLTFIHPSAITYTLPNGLYFYRSQETSPKLGTTYKTPRWNDSVVLSKDGGTYIFTKNNNFALLGTTQVYAAPSTPEYPSSYIKQIMTASTEDKVDETYPPLTPEIAVKKSTFDTSVADTLSDEATDPISKKAFDELTSELSHVPFVIARITTQPNNKLTYHFVQAKDLDEQFFAPKKPFDKNPINGEEPLATPTYYVLSNIDKKYLYLTDANVRNRTTPLDLFLQEFLNMVLVTKDTKPKTMVPLVWDRSIDLTKLEPLYKAMSNAQEKKRADELLTLLFKNYLYLGVEAWRNPHLTAIRTVADKVIPTSEIFKKNKTAFLLAHIENSAVSDDAIKAELTDKKLKLKQAEQKELVKILEQKRPTLKDIFAKKKSEKPVEEETPEEPKKEEEKPVTPVDPLAAQLQELTKRLEDLKKALAH